MHSLTVTDVRAVPGDSAFLLDDGKTAILYDSGFAFTGYAVAENIKRALGDRELDYIFLSHSHYDHVLGSAYVLKYWPHAVVAAHEHAAKIFAKSSARAVMRDLDRKFALKCGVSEYEDLIDELRVDIQLRDGDILQAGDMAFRVVSLPGHTRCSVGFYLEENRLLLGSETLGVYLGESVVVPSCLVGYEMTLDSIRRAEQLDIENILIPHFGLLDRESTEFYMKNAGKSTVETAEEIVGILRNGGSTADAVDAFREKFYHGKVVDAYPEDAMLLNTGIMVELFRKELL